MIIILYLFIKGIKTLKKKHSMHIETQAADTEHIQAPFEKKHFIFLVDVEFKRAERQVT